MLEWSLVLRDGLDKEFNLVKLFPLTILSELFEPGKDQVEQRKAP